MNLDNKHVTVIGAGVAGLTAANRLARWGIHVSLLEKTPFLGGHAIQLSCKATDACVKCGACLAEEKLLCVTERAEIDVHTGTTITAISGLSPYQIEYRTHSPLVNTDQCNGCGICFQKCPVPGTILMGRAPRVGPYVAIRRDLCRYFDNEACTLCRDVCPQGAIRLFNDSNSGKIQTDAIVMATGFSTYNPSEKPYGYGLFQNVLTSLDAERLLREQPVLQRPSDGRPAERIAFIQCVGSRDGRLGHPWCSKICCGSSLRMAQLLQSRRPETKITVFYIDVQTFGKDFHSFYKNTRENMTMVRAIPGDIMRTDSDELEIFYFDPDAKSSQKAVFDMIVLSVGLLPSTGNGPLIRMLKGYTDESGFLSPHDSNQHPAPPGIYSIGAATGPMTIAESVSSAEKAVFDLIAYLGA